MPDHASAVRDAGDDRRFKVFAVSEGEEFLRVFRGNDDGHALLRFADRELRAVKAFVLLRNGVEVDIETVRKLADRDGNAAGAEIVAAFDEGGGFAVHEQALQLPFLRGVALLHLRAAGREGGYVVGFRRTRGAAAAVAAGASAEQDHDIAGKWLIAPYVFNGSGADDSADLHMLRKVTFVIDFVHKAGGEADLVAVGAVALRGGGYELPLRELALDRFLNGSEGVRAAGDAHRVIDIAAAGERIADRAADTGRRAAERLDLRRVVMGLVFEKKQPGLLHAVNIHLHADGAGVDLARFVEIRKLAALFERFRGDAGKVHQADGLFITDLIAQGKVFFE